MIFFYNKTTGDIQATIEGRIHDKHQLNMWIGDRAISGRIVVQWKKSENGEYFPIHKQKDLFVEIDNDPTTLKKYRVDIKDKLLVSIEKDNKKD